MKIDRLTIDGFEKQESCPWWRSRRYLAVAHLQFNTAYHTPDEVFHVNPRALKKKRPIKNYNVDD